MTYILIPIALILMAMVVVSLFRGLNAFRQSLDEPGAQDGGTGATELQIRQNKMMWARIKYQLAAIGVVALLLMMAR
jgi:phage-related protein